LQSEISSVFINFWNIGYIDALLFRFTIVSDSIDTNHEGWMLDNFAFGDILLGINEYKKYNNIYIVPNPSNNVIIINSPLERIKKIEIISSIGERILEEYNTNSLYIDKIPTGFYLIRINDIYIEKLIIK